MSRVTLTVNGKAVSAEVEDRTLLVHLLRDHLGLTGTHVGCDTSQCGACVVHIDGRAVKSCTVLVGQANGVNVTTIEGISKGDELHPMQAAFRDNHGLQCGYCTPGMIMSAIDIVQSPWRRARRGDRPPRARRQYLPLHGLSQHRQVGAGRRRPHEGRAGGGIASSPTHFDTLEFNRPARVSMKTADSQSSGRERCTWALKALAQALCARKTSVSSPARAATSTTSSSMGMTHAHFVRSPHAHAKVKGVDTPRR